jgi:GTP-binding protein Era
VLIAVLNIDEPDAENLEQIVKLCEMSGKPWIALINKTDLPQLHRPQIMREKMIAKGVPVLQGSALKEGKGLRESLVERLLPMLPAADGPLYDEDLYTLSSTRELCAEIVREKCFENLHQEIPFGLAVRILKFTEDDGPVLKIHLEILVAKDNHRPIVVGRGAQVIKKIGMEARKSIEKLVGRKVYLDLRVAAKRNWAGNPGVMKELGYVLPKA